MVGRNQAQIKDNNCPDKRRPVIFKERVQDNMRI
jgi:hypothetical protein